jgi:exodeoxyribonuclease X
MITYHILDTETASLQGGVVEIAWLEVDNQLQILNEFVTRVNPERPIDPGAFAVHGISDEEVKDAPTLAQVAASLPETGIHLIGHNSAFDRRMINKEIHVVDALCTLMLSRQYVKGTTNNKLETLQKELKFPEQTSHSALGDVHTCLDLLKYLMQLSGLSLETMFDRQRKPIILQTMPFGAHKGKPFMQVPKQYREWLLTLPDLDPSLRSTLEKLRNV